ncbi:MAG TPA: carboxypeptidase regulatory-like domain-containing protein, partial [Thermoanaerobaculia bacterium]|nr:carboxypeptidase regulatory-like domain-containing protein [Thermoanaerobaculia bacterium]
AYGDGGPIAGAPVSCQGRSTTTSGDGAYNLTGLMSGRTTVTVTVNYPPITPVEFSVELKPGSNTVDLGLY